MEESAHLKNDENKPYRNNVGMIIFNSRGEVLVGDRIDYPEKFQFPQGGIDEGENPEDAAKRELYEEIGLKVDHPVFEIPEWLLYEFPEDIPDHLRKYRGQRQKWFFYYWDGDLSTLNLNIHQREFRTVKWMNIEELVQNIVEFKKNVYKTILKYYHHFVPEFLKEKKL